MKMKPIGKNLNGTHLNSLIGGTKERTIYKKFLLNQITNEEIKEDEKKQCREELIHIRQLEKSTSDKQEKHAAFRFGTFVIWSITILSFALISYLLTTNLMQMLDLEGENMKAIIGLTISLLIFQMSVASASLFRGANIKVKDNIKKD